MKRPHKKSVLVTGASSGIGEAISVHLAREGFRVFAAARTEAALSALSGLGQGRITPVLMDVTIDESVEDGLAEIAAEGQPLYGLVNNAGIAVAGPVEAVPQSEWQRQFETNVFGLVRVSRAVLPQMRAAGGGRIVNIGSVAGRIVTPFMAPYGASKHAVEGLSDALRRECRGHGIAVSLIRPGVINTHLGEKEEESLRRFADQAEPYAEAIGAFLAWHGRQHPTAAPPSVVAEAVEHALTGRRPHARYTVPRSFLILVALRNFLPTRLFDRILERTIGLPGNDKR